MVSNACNVNMAYCGICCDSKLVLPWFRLNQHKTSVLKWRNDQIAFGASGKIRVDLYMGYLLTFCSSVRLSYTSIDSDGNTKNDFVSKKADGLCARLMEDLTWITVNSAPLIGRHWSTTSGELFLLSFAIFEKRFSQIGDVQCLYLNLPLRLFVCQR